MFFASFWLLYYLFISVALIVGLHADIVLMMYYTVLTTFYRGTIESIWPAAVQSGLVAVRTVAEKSIQSRDSRENHQDLSTVCTGITSDTLP